MKSKAKISSKEFAIAAAKVAVERHCEDVKVLNLTGLSPATDFFVVATGTSDRQIKTIADEVGDVAKENKYFRLGVAGYEQATWILLDYVDVMVHVMSEESRDYYNLEMLWGDAEEVKID